MRGRIHDTAVGKTLQTANKCRFAPFASQHLRNGVRCDLVKLY